MTERAEILQFFADQLEMLRVAAGNPPYAYLAKSSPWLKRSTISDALCGRSSPSLDFVVAFVSACRAYAERHQIGASGELFEPDAWRQRWMELQQELGSLRRAKRPRPTAAEGMNPGAAPPLPPRQLPAPPYPFIGRDPYLRSLDTYSTARSVAGSGEPSALVIDGAAGVGKTSLVLYWARHRSVRFPDGDLYLDLRGHRPSGSPVTPMAAMRALLGALRVPSGQIPDDPDQASVQWRSALAEKHLLVLLDNAASAEQVRPLIPGTGRSTVIITSRRRLHSLIIRDGVVALTLEPMTPAEARALLDAVLGGQAAAEPDEADALASVCGNNPLALRVLADRVAAYPRPLTQILRELRSRHPLEALSAADGEQSTIVGNVLGWSYHSLPDGAARLFRLLALHPGPQVCPEAAAALAATRPDITLRNLLELADIHLVFKAGHSHYRMHDLVRHLSTQMLNARESDEEKAAAAWRETQWYLHSAAAADRVLMPGRRNLVDTPPPERVQPMVFSEYQEAITWCDAERGNIVGIVRQAAKYRWLDTCWKLPTILLSYFNLRKTWTEWTASFNIALDAARQTGDRYAEANCLNALGIAHRELGHSGVALNLLKEAASAFHELGEAEGECYALNNIGLVYHKDATAFAVSVLAQALRLARVSGSQAAELVTLQNLGESYLNMGRLDDAFACALECLAIHQRTNDVAGIGFALTTIGEIQSRRGRFDEACRYLRAAVTARSQVGDIQGEAVALFRLGRALAARGDRVAAGDYFRRARAVLEPLGDPLAAEIRAAQRHL